ncbi:MAG: ribosome maturation factor RimP [Proteobacteria bacterium]|nr:ribosome maturation factor RimP [Pseudomonadota bacterium]
MNRKELQVEQLLKPTIEAMGFVLWGLEYLAQGRQAQLRIYIDGPEGVSVDDCAKVSRQVSGLLDVEEVISVRYTLEVSSPGIDRILFSAPQFEASVGQTVDVRLNFPFEGRKKIVGLLAGVEDMEAVVRLDDQEFLLPLENIRRARIVPHFD